MNKQKGQGGILILVGILVLALVATGAYYLGKSSSPKPSPYPSPSDETANWKTYMSLNYGFEFKYPPDWFTHENKPDQYRLLDLFVTADEKAVSLSSRSDPHRGFTIQIEPDSYDEATIQKTEEDSGPAFVGFHYQPITFLNLPANKSYMTFTDIEFTSLPPNYGPGITYIRFNKAGYGWLLGYPNTDFAGNHNQIYDQILSTFKFIE